MGALIDSRELHWEAHAESFKLLIVGSPSLKISVYSKHISLRSALWPGLFFITAGSFGSARLLWVWDRFSCGIILKPFYPTCFSVALRTLR